MKSEIGKKKRWSLKGHLMWFKVLRRTHFLPLTKKKTLLIMIFDDRVIYTYINPVPIFKEIDGKLCEVENERVKIYDRTVPTLKTDSEQDGDRV